MGKKKGQQGPKPAPKKDDETHKPRRKPRRRNLTWRQQNDATVFYVLVAFAIGLFIRDLFG